MLANMLSAHSLSLPSVVAEMEGGRQEEGGGGGGGGGVEVGIDIRITTDEKWLTAAAA